MLRQFARQSIRHRHRRIALVGCEKLLVDNRKFRAALTGGEIDGRFDDVIQSSAGFLDNVFDMLQRHLSLIREISLSFYDAVRSNGPELGMNIKVRQMSRSESP